MRLIRLIDCPEEAWANGSGVTRQLLSDGEAPEPWNWRLSVATVSEPGPFSSLPGIDRILVCVGDSPLSLSIDGLVHEVQPAHPISFVGESDVASLGTAATRDVNVMVRRATTVAGVAVIEEGDPFVRVDDSEVTAFIALTDDTTIGGRLLAIGDTMIVEDRDQIPGSLARGRCLRVAIRPR